VPSNPSQASPIVQVRWTKLSPALTGGAFSVRLGSAIRHRNQRLGSAHAVVQLRFGLHLSAIPRRPIARAPAELTETAPDARIILSRDYGDLGVERNRLGGRSRAEQQPLYSVGIQVRPKDQLIRVPPGVGATMRGRCGAEFIPALLALALARCCLGLQSLSSVHRKPPCTQYRECFVRAAVTS
jgi:hypothetical protein